MQAGRWQQTRRRISAAHFQPSVLVTLRGIACREPWGESCIMLVLCHLLKLSHISIVRVEGHCSHQMDETNLDKHPLMPRKMHLFIPFPCFSYSLRIPLLRGNPIEPSAWWYRPFNDITIHHQQPSRGHGWNPAGPLETLPTKCPCPIMSMGHTSFFLLVERRKHCSDKPCFGEITDKTGYTTRIFLARFRDGRLYIQIIQAAEFSQHRFLCVLFLLRRLALFLHLLRLKERWLTIQNRQDFEILELWLAQPIQCTSIIDINIQCLINLDGQPHLHAWLDRKGILGPRKLAVRRALPLVRLGFLVIPQGKTAPRCETQQKHMTC